MDSQVEFAILMRAMAARKLDDMTFLHCSMRTDEMAEEGLFVINTARPRPFWASTATDSVIIDPSGDDDSGAGILPNSQWRLHKDIYRTGSDLRCILHVHTAETVAVAGLSGFRQVHQNAALFLPGFLACVPYYGLNEYQGVVEHISNGAYAILMEGHGAIVVGRTIGEAFEILVNLQDCCVKELTIPLVVKEFHPDVVAKAHQDWVRSGRPFGAHSWPAERDAIYADLKRSGDCL